ncbi:MAG: helix-turn-helix domain-containing protein [Candidatus Pacebacteria bacterium]|nr:helix-turn-helix domain-containing protein [Candidatus Paceibacterota bacterium]
MLNKKQLVEIGFTEKEAMVYLALLEMGPSTVSEIGRQAKINRTTGYDILEMLCSKGLVNALGEGTVKKYTAENPEKIVAFSKNKFQEAQDQLEASKKLLPELKSVFHKTEKPKVKFYEGRGGLKEVYEDTLINGNSIILAYACAEPMYQSLPNFLPNYLKQRVVKKINARMIAPDTIGIKELVKTDKQNLRESRMVPKEKLDIAVEINIYDNKVMIASWEENLGIIIESQKIADAQKKIFELAWEGAGKYQGSK